MSEFKRTLTRYLLGIPRSIAPVLRLGQQTFVFRDADVREILRRDQDFVLGPVNGENISRHIGPFVLGMDDGPRYQRDIGILRGAVHRQDPERIRGFFRAKATELARQLPGQFDLVQDYARLLPLLFIGDYFGVPGPERETMWRWNRTLFWDVFLDLKNDPGIRQAAEQSAREMNAFLDDLIRDRKAVMNAGGRLPDDFLSRLLAGQSGSGPSFDDAEIRGNVAGVFLGALEPTNKAFVNIVNQLIHRPKVLAQAREAAQRDDVDLLKRIALEALRFHPNAPTLMRKCEQAQTLGGDGRRQRTIRAGQTVFAMTGSAMFDRRKNARPHLFDPNRPPETYLYFGLGLHTCFGNYVNFISLPEMLNALLKLPHIAPANGKAGKIQFEGPFPDSWKWQRKA